MKLKDLKAELEKRSLSTHGTRMTLELRLKAAKNTENQSAGQQIVPSPQDIGNYLLPMGSAIASPFAFGQATEQVEPVVTNRAMMESGANEPTTDSVRNEDVEMGPEKAPAAMYPPQTEFLPLTKTDATPYCYTPYGTGRPKGGILSRLGSSSASGSLGISNALANRLSNPARKEEDFGHVSVFQRLGGSGSEQADFQGRPGDWKCEEGNCGNINFARRNECHKCFAPKHASGGTDFRPAQDGDNVETVFNEERRMVRAKRFKDQTNPLADKSNTMRSTGWARSRRNQDEHHAGDGGRRLNAENGLALMLPLVEIYQEYDIDKMEDRAEKFSDVNMLKRRARRFDEETADELVQPKEAQKKNDRFKRFKLGDESSSDSEDDLLRLD